MTNTPNYQSDFFIFIPYYIENQEQFLKQLAEECEKNKQSELGTKYLEMMETVFNYECVPVLANDVKRVYLGDYHLSCNSDSTIHKVESYEGDVMVFLTYSLLTNLVVVTIVSLTTKFPLSFMLEELNRNNGMVLINNEYEKLDRHFWNCFKMHRCGGIKHLAALSEYPTDKSELIYITMSEEYGFQDIDSTLKNVDRHKFAEIGQYEILDAFASYAGVTLVFNEYENDTLERLYHESIFVFVCELLQFKLLAITRTNRVVVNLLETDPRPSVKNLEAISAQFAKTIRFWDVDNFRYLSTRIMAKGMSDAFETDAVMEVYQRNQKFLEHIISIRSAQESERENKVLSILAITLTLIQLIPIFYEIVHGVIRHTITMNSVVSAISACGLTGVITVLVVVLLKKLSQKHF